MKIKLTQLFDRPATEVFAVFTDLRRAPERVRGIKHIAVLTDGPMRVGTQFRETRVMFGRDASELMTVTEFTPDRSYAVSATSCGCDFRTEFRFIPTGNRTRVEMEISSTPTTLMAKLMAPLGVVMARSMKRLCAQELDDLKQAIEMQPA
jgi:hypothetical protein